VSGASLPFARPTPTPLHPRALGPGTDQTVLAPTPPPMQRKSGSKVPLIVALVVLLAAGGAFAAYQMMGSEPAPKQAALAPEPPKPPPPPPKPAEPAPPPKRETVTLKLAVEPASATVTIDGKPVTGGELTAPRDDAKHQLHIAAPGFAPHDEEIDLSESQRIAVQLKKAAHAAPTTKKPKDPKNDRIESESPYK